MKILIAEDDYANRKYLYELLREYGECDQVIDGLETVEAYVLAYGEGDPYDYLFVDIMMPKIDGLKALETIRAFEDRENLDTDKRSKAIIISGLSPEEALKNSQSLNDLFFLSKPFNAQDIERIMKNLKRF